MGREGGAGERRGGEGEVREGEGRERESREGRKRERRTEMTGKPKRVHNLRKTTPPSSDGWLLACTIIQPPLIRNFTDQSGRYKTNRFAYQTKKINHTYSTMTSEQHGRTYTTVYS